MKLITVSILILTEILTISTLAQRQISFELLLASDPSPSVPPGTPENRTRSGTRNPCNNNSRNSSLPPLTPLLPKSDSVENFSGLTLKEHPTFWFYSSYQNRDVSLGSFSLEDSQGNRFYKINFQLPSTPGFISISLPQDKSLEENQQYRWTFRVYCQPSFESASVPYQGTIERVSIPSISSQIVSATLGNRITLYEKNQLWYDASENLAEIRLNPQEWANFLKSMKLENLNQAPVLGEVLPVEK